MKKWICSTLLLGGLAVAGGAAAQATACTNAVGPYADPACSGPPSSAWTGHGYAYTGPGAQHYPYFHEGHPAYVAPHLAVPYGLARIVNPRDLDGDGIRNRRDRDRDGDGVRNRRDRYPDDPRYR